MPDSGLLTLQAREKKKDVVRLGERWSAGLGRHVSYSPGAGLRLDHVHSALEAFCDATGKAVYITSFAWPDKEGQSVPEAC